MSMLTPGQMALYIGRELPMLPITADLMPPEVVSDRRDRKVRRIVIVAVTGFTVLLAGWFGIAKYQTALAEDNLIAAQAEVDTLKAKQREFAAVIKIKDESRQITEQLKKLMANDLQWDELLVAIRAIAPADMNLVSVNGNVSPDGAQQPVTLAKRYSDKHVGTLRIAGNAPTRTQIADFVDALNKVVGVGNPLISEVNAGPDGLAFTLSADITSAVFDGRFTPRSASPSPSK